MDLDNKPTIWLVSWNPKRTQTLIWMRYLLIMT